MTRTILLIPLLAFSLLAQRAADPGATLTVSSDPAGATILLNRVAVGSTPATVSVTPGVQLLTLQKPGFNDTFLTINPVAGAPTILPLVRLEPQVAWVLLHSEPQGARVTSDNIPLGDTPTLVKVIPPTVRAFNFALPGYQPQTIELEVKDQTPILKTVVLASDSGTLKLATDPPGARILVNGIPRGTTPATLERLDTEIILELLLDGFIPVNQTIRLAAGQIETLNLPLTPQPAILSVASIPDKARIYLENAFQGEAPVTIDGLPPGTYRVRAEKERHDPDARNVELKNGDKRSIEFRLLSNQGRLEITTEPAGVAIFIDGKRVGETTASANQTDKISNPCAVEDVATGVRELRLVRRGFKEHRENITIERGRTFTKHFTLERLFIPDYEVVTVGGVVHRGVLDVRTAEFVRLETAPGIFTTVRTENIRSQRPLRDDAN